MEDLAMNKPEKPEYDIPSSVPVLWINGQAGTGHRYAASAAGGRYVRESDGGTRVGCEEGAVVPTQARHAC